MSKNKSPKPVSARYLTFFGGVFFCLLSVSLILNIGYINRVLTFIPNFLFGVGSFAIYVFLYVLGVSFLFREKGFKVRLSFQFFGFLIFFVGLLILTSMIGNHGKAISGSTFLDMFNHMVVSSGDTITKYNYLTYKDLNIFGAIQYQIGENPISNFAFGGGLAGNALCGLIVSGLNEAWAWFFGIFISLVGAILFSIPFIRKAVKKSKVEKKAAPIVNSPEAVNDPSITSTEPNKTTNIRKEDYQNASNSINLVKEAGDYVPPVNTSTFDVSPISRPSFSANNGKSNASVNNFPNDGGFVRAHFVRPGMVESAPVTKEAPIEFISGEEALLAANAKQTHAEQLTLDFNAKPVINTELAQAKPTFVERKVINPTPTLDSIDAVRETVEPTTVKKPLVWVPPSSELLDTLESAQANEENQKVAEERRQLIDLVLSDFNIGAKVIDFTIGPSVTRFNIDYDSNVSSRSINNLVDDLSRRLGGVPARFEPVIEGQIYSGLEIPNKIVTPVGFKELYEKLPEVKKHPLSVAFGKNISGEVIAADFDEFPHILVAGTTGSGKSVFIHSLIATLIMRNSPDDVRLALIDPKRVEMVKYRDMPHLLCPIVSDSSQAALFLNKLVDEMNDRYTLFEEADGCTSIKEYNEYALENHKPKIPYIVVIIDEYGDLVSTHKEVTQPILLIGQKARACGIHMLISTQSPTSNIITGTIRSNLATHVALSTANVQQSISILGEGGAEKLLGKGDMLVQSPLVSRVGLVRLQGCFIQRKEIFRVVGYLKEHYPLAYNERFMNLEEEAAQAGQAAVANGSVGAAFDEADENRYQGIKEWVMSQQYMSMSRIQGECSVGFNRARRFFTRLQQEGVVGTDVEGNKGCRVLAHGTSASEESLPSSEDYSSIG